MRALVLLALVASSAQARESNVELIRRLVPERCAQEDLEEVVARGLFFVAGACAQAGAPLVEVDLLEATARRWPRYATLSLVERARIFERRRRPRAVLDALRTALLAAAPIDYRHDLLHSQSAANDAYEWLVRLLEKRGAWHEVYHLHTTFRPYSFCGNCSEGMEGARILGRARALWALGSRRAAIALVEDRVAHPGLNGVDRNAERWLARRR